VNYYYFFVLTLYVLSIYEKPEDIGGSHIHFDCVENGDHSSGKLQPVMNLQRSRQVDRVGLDSYFLHWLKLDKYCKLANVSFNKKKTNLEIML
jgi:hypothetical protein